MKDIEKTLLSNASLDELIKMRIEQEFRSGASKPKAAKKAVLEIKDAPADKIFSKDSVFHVFNRKNGTETFINGLQADAMIGLQSGIREQFLNKNITTFSTEDAYFKFEKAYL